MKSIILSYFLHIYTKLIRVSIFDIVRFYNIKNVVKDIFMGKLGKIFGIAAAIGVAATGALIAGKKKFALI